MMAMTLEDSEPALCGTLSDELLQLVFLRLPVVEIKQIRLLSKTWKSSIDSVDSYLSRILDDTVYPNLFGLIDFQFLCARIFDVKRDQWYIRSIDTTCDWTLAVGTADEELDCSDTESTGNSLIAMDAADGELHCSESGSTENSPLAMGAADGGLVCFILESAENPLSFVVMNPLTGKKVGLPPLLSIHDVRPTILPSMVQLTMDRQTNQYKVVVVGYLNSGNRGLFAQVYDSQTKQWSVVGSGENSGGRIFGYEYAWIRMGDENDKLFMEPKGEYYSERLGPCLYDFADGQLHRFNGNDIVKKRSVRSYALLRDRLFALHKKRRAGPSNLIQSGQERKYYISEYHLPKNGTAWVKVETHGCEPFEDFPEENHHLSFHAANGFLMVIAQDGDDDDVGDLYLPHDKYEYVWLYSLSTYKWQVLSKVPGFYIGAGSLNLMCELRWSARP